ncbi:hypothetical protein AADZ90_001220 [Aestuariibius sp. 2305UL40-4]|uniref:hypothetical protein n=1 Tax=Aestuariibius violaceus TaxID=3234132 RepID=UPI00345F0039
MKPRSCLFYASAIPIALAGCGVPDDNRTVVDTGIDAGPLQNGVAEVWVDPDGCQHWVIDDGVEGYMTPRRSRPCPMPK